MIYSKHIFVCTNQRPDGAPKPSCGLTHGEAIIAEFKKLVRQNDLSVEIRTQKTGCMDVCEQGPAIVVYPDGVFYKVTEMSDVKRIVDEHLVGGKVVVELVIHSKISN